MLRSGRHFYTLVLIAIILCAGYYRNFLKSFQNRALIIQKPNVWVYDLTASLDKELFDSIRCVKAFRAINISINICLHKNEYVSNAIENSGAWETSIISKYKFS